MEPVLNGADDVEKWHGLILRDIDGQRFVVEHIKRPLRQYVVGLNLRGVTTRIQKALAE